MGFFDRIREGLSKTKQQIVERFDEIASQADAPARKGRPIDVDTIDALEELLIMADVGIAATDRIIAAVKDQTATGKSLRDAVKDEIRAIFAAVQPAAAVPSNGHLPHVVLIVGVNGTGKTTTIAKLANRLIAEGKTLTLAAADTFRAAAIEQLRIWGEQLGVPVVAQRAGADPGAVAFDAVSAAESRGLDAVLVDTAGRLQNKQQLMDELAKIRRVIERRLPGQPRHVILVLDATTGQNGLVQAEAFSREAGVTGIVLTKLDGSAKGGVALAAADRLGVPILFAGVGEEIDALAPFDPEAYVEWLFAE